MSQYTVLFDANVLYPAPMRDALMQLAVTDLFKAKWTADIHRECFDALLRNEPHRDRAALERTRDLMDMATRDCLVTGYEALVPALTLPDPDDRHVLAAAIVGRCDAIVTQNLKDFPPETLAPFSIETQHPDDFFRNQRRCCRTQSVKDSHRESMRLDDLHEQAQARPLPHDELVQLQRCAQEARIAADLAGQGDDLARAA